MGAPFRHLVLTGDHRAVGEQHGEALRDDIGAHLELIYEGAASRSGLTRERSLALAASFLPFIERWSPGFVEELRGLARAAAIPVEEAVLLQVRQEVRHIARLGVPAEEGVTPAECTTFAVAGRHTAAGDTLAGQNADLSGPMEEVSSVLTFAVTGKPRVTMVIPAGQLSYIGMSSEGLSASANFLYCPGWRVGYPRYLLTRRALEQPTLAGAERAALEPPRAASRNLLLASHDGDMVDLETTVDRHGRLSADDGVLVHSNHYLSAAMGDVERSTEIELQDSTGRCRRMRELLRDRLGELTLEDVKRAYADHANAPHSICRHPARPGGSKTFCSMIVDLGRARMSVATYPVCESEYGEYPA